MIFNRNLYASLFLILFLCFKVADLHVLSQNDFHANDCELCLINSSVNQDPFLFSEIISVKNYIPNYNRKKAKIKISASHNPKTILEGLKFSRPPPNIL